jgi:hypothetical protein
VDHEIRDEVRAIAVSAAQRGVPLDDVALELAPLLLSGVPALELVRAASEDYEWALRCLVRQPAA